MSGQGTGIKEWSLQRLSAVYLGVYLVFLVGFVACQSTLTFEQWHALFSHTAMQVATIIALVMIAVHAWIGLSIVAADYLKITVLRMLFSTGVFFALLGYVVWGVAILWG